MSRLFQEILKKRGFSEEFLHPSYEGLPEAFSLPDMEKAVERLILAGTRGERVLIYGDYDVDGVTASVIMQEILGLIGVSETFVMLPDRFKDGYGMSSRVITEAERLGVKLVVTVDCGSNNGEVIAKLAEVGVDVIVTDHHELASGVPEAAVAVVNPKRVDFQGPKELRELCGAGVAFFVARALVAKGCIPEGREKWLLDLVMIGTICDSMVITGVNRVLCHFGLIVLMKTKRVGLKELMRVAGVKTADTHAIGYQIGPRLNAAGRMASADIAYKLIIARSRVEAAGLAEELEKLNSERKRQQSEAVRGISEGGIPSETVIVVSGAWHEGIIGIVAGRLTEKYRRPAFVLTEVDGVLKGSGRSFGDFNLALALSECQDCLIAGGGHAGACGVKVAPEKLDEFRRRINQYYMGLRLKGQEKYFEVAADATVSRLAELNLELIEELALLEPYGEGNPEPVLRLPEMTVLETKAMGTEGKHLRLTVRDTSGGIMKLVAFFAKQGWFEVQPGEMIEVMITPMANEWNGATTFEGRIVEIKK